MEGHAKEFLAILVILILVTLGVGFMFAYGTDNGDKCPRCNISKEQYMPN